MALLSSDMAPVRSTSAVPVGISFRIAAAIRMLAYEQRSPTSLRELQEELCSI
jgi:hypothetical protein